MNPLILLWTSSFTVAGVGTWVLFDGAWGVNTAVWTATAAAGLLVCARGGGGRIPSTLVVTLGLTVLLAGGTAVTADAIFHCWIAVALVVLLSVATLLAADGRDERLDVILMAQAPLVAAHRGLAEVGRRVAEIVDRLSADRSRPWVRGVVIALPILVLFGLLLADADPVFATLRRSLRETLEQWDFLPRLVFLTAILIAALGAGGLALRGTRVPGATRTAPTPGPRLGLTERLVVLVAVTALFAVFLLLQVSYLFGNAPAVTGSGITFAEYARRGFNELTIVATLCALLVIALDGQAERGTAERSGRLVAVGLVGETLLLLVSAFRRVWLYEAAYGFTTTRLYAQAYMIVMAAMLLLLAWEIRRGVDTPRLARRTAGLAVLAFATLIYWNHEAWIVVVNVERAVHTGTVDASYLVRGLSPNAVPALVRAQSSAPEAVALPLRQELRARYGTTRARQCRWFEANVRHAQAVRALEASGLAAIDTRPLRDGCLRLETIPREVVGPRGFEPLAFGFVARRSVHLS
jgi:Domain of unknown function (DUF4173)